MAEWSGEYISPYAEHGKKSEQVKKITVSIPLKVLKILTDERTRSCVSWGLIRKRGNTDSKACGQNASGRAFLTIPLVHGYLRHCSKCSSSRITLGG